MSRETRIQVIKSDGSVIENASWKIFTSNIQSGNSFYLSTKVEESLLSKVKEAKSRYVTIDGESISIMCKVREIIHDFNIDQKLMESMIILEAMDRAAENIIDLIYGQTPVPVPGLPRNSS
jgi:low affinity Fe/Cu permease